MNESNAIKAITIGVGIIIAIATITLVLMYYNTAKEGLSALGTGNNVYENYEEYVRTILTKKNVYGTDIINLLNYFKNDRSIKISITDIDNVIHSTTDNNFNSFESNILPNEKFNLTVNNYEGTDITVVAVD